MKKLEDSDPMPFGEHKGKKMEDVPAQYLDWLRGQQWLYKYPQVKAYIEDPLTAKSIDYELKEKGII